MNEVEQKVAALEKEYAEHLKLVGWSGAIDRLKTFEAWVIGKLAGALVQAETAPGVWREESVVARP